MKPKARATKLALNLTKSIIIIHTLKVKVRSSYAERSLFTVEGIVCMGNKTVCLKKQNPC